MSSKRPAAWGPGGPRGPSVAGSRARNLDLGDLAPHHERLQSAIHRRQPNSRAVPARPLDEVAGHRLPGPAPRIQDARPGRERAGELSQDRRGVEQITASGVGFRQVVVQQGQVGQGQASPGSRRGAGFATV